MLSNSQIILIGAGPHARRIYLPLCRHFENIGKLKLIAVVDLVSQQQQIDQALSTNGYDPSSIRRIFIDDSKSHEIPTELDTLLSHHRHINSVIISTEPLRHFHYATWALDRGLNILMDKPISTYENVATHETQATRFIPDFELLLEKYRLARRERGVKCFSVMAQRRYHTSYNYIASVIREVFDQTNCPVTSINTIHSDGQWRTPSEMLTQLYHSYYQGYGKGSHSGYHYFDIIPYFLAAGIGSEKYYDEMEASAIFVRPTDFLAQLSLDDHARQLRGNEFLRHNSRSEYEYFAELRKCGEMDLSAQIELKQNGHILTHLNLYLGHNGVSQRNWAHPEGRDLYKGIGRVAHETHLIEQGPFQAIQFHSYKSKDNTLGPEDYGGEQHLDVVVYRNNRLFGGEHVKRFRLKDFTATETGFRPISSPAKMRCFEDFLNASHGFIERSHTDLETQRPAIELTQAIYLSAVRRFHSTNSILKFPFSLIPSGSKHEYGALTDAG